MSYQSKTVEKSGKSVEQAIELALAELGATRDQVEVVILDEPAKGLFGIIGSKEAKVSVTLKDGPRERAIHFLDELLIGLGIRATVDAVMDGDKQLNINLSGNDMGIIIGKRGETLDAVQYLTSLVVNKGEESYVRVTLDTENYRKKREEALTTLAKRIASKVSKTGKRYTLEPMSAYERRVIHAALQDTVGVSTHSIGEEPYRKVVVVPK